MVARSRKRSALAGRAKPSARTAPMAAARTNVRKGEIDSVRRSGSERRQIQEKALQPAHFLHFSHGSLAAVLDASISHLNREHLVGARDVVRVHHARDAHLLTPP